jgi:hypothetical protein
MSVLKNFSARRETALQDAMRLAEDMAMQHKGWLYVLAWTMNRQAIAVHQCQDLATGKMLAEGLATQGRYIDHAYAAKSQAEIALGV